MFENRYNTPCNIITSTNKMPVNIYIVLECRKVEKPTTSNKKLEIFALTASSLKV